MHKRNINTKKKILTGLINLIAKFSFMKYKDAKKQKAVFSSFNDFACREQY